MKTKTFIIKVTAKDIKLGTRESTFSCPIAIAVRRRVKTREEIGVEPSALVVLHPDGWKLKEVAPLPVKAQTFVIAFDEENKVRPFSFKVKLPVSIL